MSRAYRIKVRDSLAKLLKAGDQLSTELALLEILPCEEMAQLLVEELARRGFQQEGDEWVRSAENGVQIRIAPETGTVTVEIEGCEEVTLTQEREGRLYEDVGPTEEEGKTRLREAIRQDLEKQAATKQAKLQTDLTDKLEKTLRSLQPELDQVINRVTGEALKKRAAQLGQIKEMTEDPETGSLTLVVEL